jgi:outer membrane protein OmpA-like peptidoglycan-associated protein
MLFTGFFVQAQEDTGNNYGTPKDMIEVGIGGGYAFVAGDVTQSPGYGVGLHIRKSLDYVFSLRFDGFYGTLQGEETLAVDNVRRFETTYIAGTGYGVISANSLRWNNSVRKVNLFAMIGVGGSYFKADSQSGGRTPADDSFPDEGEFGFAPHIAGGAGLAFRISPRINIGLDHQAFFVFGSRSDRIDGIDQGTNRFRDIMNFTQLTVNFNIGSTTKSSEPLYWVNPLENVISDLSDMKKQSKMAIEDTDNDGVIDAIDQEPNTPPDVPVDTKGRTLDSDRDGVPDYKDREPYFPPRPGERVDEEGVVVNPITPQGGGGVSEDRVREIIAEELQNYQLRDQGSTGGGATGGGPSAPMTEWFLPMIHFGADSDRVKYSDYGTLASIARMMKGNPNLRIVVTGYADASSTEEYNNALSYRRANAVVEHLVNNHGIGRGRMVIQWKGESELLVPTGNSYMNRRVEFRVAQSGDVEMDPPSGNSQDETGGDGY